VDRGPSFQPDSSLRDRFLIQQIPGGRIIGEPNHQQCMLTTKPCLWCWHHVCTLPCSLTGPAAAYLSVGGATEQHQVTVTESIPTGTCNKKLCSMRSTQDQYAPDITRQTCSRASSTHTRVSRSSLINSCIMFQCADVVEQAAGSSPSSEQEHAGQQQQQQQQPGHSTTLSCTIPSRFCGLSATTAGGSVTVGQLQEADMQLSTAGGAVQVTRCRAHNASINTAVQALGQQQQPPPPAELHPKGGSIQVGDTRLIANNQGFYEQILLTMCAQVREVSSLSPGKRCRSTGSLCWSAFAWCSSPGCAEIHDSFGLSSAASGLCCCLLHHDDGSVTIKHVFALTCLVVVWCVHVRWVS